MRALELVFRAAVHSIETGQERRLATFYLMNTSPNRNRWGVTDKALSEALPALLGKPIGCGPGYKIDRHYANPIQVGRWVKVDKPDGYALATAEITDPVAWEKVASGEWGPISVVIKSYLDRCSVCGQELTSIEDPWSHDHIKSGQGYIVVESFTFNRVDFVADPAYPQAGLINLAQAEGIVPLELLASYYTSGSMKMDEGKTDMTSYTGSAVSFEQTVKAPEDRSWDADAAIARVRSWAGGPDKDSINWSKYRRAFAWYDQGDPENFGSYKLPHHDIIDGRLSVVWRGVSAAMGALLGARGGVNIPAGDRRAVYNHLRRHYAQFDKEPPDFSASKSNDGRAAGSPGLDPESRRKKEEPNMTAELEARISELEAQVKKLEAEKADLQSKLEAATDPDEVKRLKAELDELKAERHMELVNAVVDARFTAGLAADKAKERDRLKDLDDATLKVLLADAEKVAERIRKATPRTPKTKYTKTDIEPLQAAVEEMRQRLFGYRRDAEGKVK